MTQSQTPNPGVIERHRVEPHAHAAWTGSLFEGQGHDGFKITSVDLDVSGHVSGIDPNLFQEAVQRAAGLCPVSNALKSNVDISWQARLEY
jgi:organic hydroperoxide reductase OsmC/OhrA